MKRKKNVSVKPGKCFPVGSKRNQDIIDFRYALIDKMYPMDDDKREPISDNPELMRQILVDFNNHFGSRGYDIG